MAGLLTSTLRTESARQGAQLVASLKLFFASGNRLWSTRPVTSATVGQHVARVTNWSPIRRAVSGSNKRLSLASMGASILDDDRSFARLLRDENRYSVTGTRALVQVGSFRDPLNPGWTTFFDGVLDKRDQQSPYLWTLGFSSNDKPLLGPIPKLGLLPADWPNPGDRSIYGLWAPSYWGVHDSRGSTDAGAVPCYFVDRLINGGFGRYLVAFRWLKSVPRVYRNGALATSTTYAVTHPLVGGRRWTCIEPTSSWGTDTVTADVTGYEATGDGSGALIDGANVPKHQLVNFIYNDPTGDGAWRLDSEAPVNTTGFAAAQTFLTRQGWQQISAAIGGAEQITGLDAMSRFLETKLALNAFFTRDGKISLAPDDHATTTLSYDEPRYIRHDKHEVGSKEGSFQGPEFVRDQMADRLSVRYLPDAVAGDLRRTLEVRDIRRDPTNPAIFLDGSAPGSLDLPWSHASLE